MLRCGGTARQGKSAVSGVPTLMTRAAFPFEVMSRGSDIEMTGEYEGRGQATAWKEVFHMTSPSGFTQILYVGAPGEELKKVSTIIAGKKS